MKSIIAVLACGVLSAGCIGTLDARVALTGSVEPPPGTSCQLFLEQSSRPLSQLDYGADVRGSFTKWFTVHPFLGPYRAYLKCGESVKLLREFEYREFSSNPYDIGRIAL